MRQKAEHRRTTLTLFTLTSGLCLAYELPGPNEPRRTDFMNQVIINMEFREDALTIDFSFHCRVLVRKTARTVSSMMARFGKKR